MSTYWRYSSDSGTGTGDPVTMVADADAGSAADAGLLAAEIISDSDVGRGADALAFETGFGDGAVVLSLDAGPGARLSAVAGAGAYLVMLAQPG